MKNDFLTYVAGLCQAASAALMAAAVITPELRVESITGCVVCAYLGGIFIVLKNME